MCDLPMFQRALRKYVFHPKFSFSEQKWDLHFLNLRLLPSIFIQTAKLSGKARVKPQADIPENVKHQVQQVLQDYLYYTRDFNFTDAKYISINAPCFIYKLLSNVRRQKDLTSALQKHLLYNPINEFEPFFESIGIKPCDIRSLLPPHQLFMKENQALLATVSTLSNIGFPRQELGKLYKEHPKIFSSSSKELQNKLQFYENLGVSKASLVRILICCPSVLNDDVYRNFKAVTIGLNDFQLEKSRICSLMETNLHNKGTILEKLMLFVGIGCSWDEISKLFHTKSDLINNGSAQFLYVIIEFLSSLGIQKENIGSFVLKYPEILNPELAKCMEVCAESVGLYQKEAREKIDFHRGKLIKLLECMVRTVFEKQIFFAFIKDLKSMKPLTPLSKDGPEKNRFMLLDGVNVINKSSPKNFQSIMMKGGDLANRKNDLVVDSFQQKHSASVQEIEICEHLQRPISRPKRKNDLVVDSFQQKHSASVREIEICENLHRPISRPKRKNDLVVDSFQQKHSASVQEIETCENLQRPISRSKRKNDLVVDSFQQKHSASVQEVEICENLQRPISKPKRKNDLVVDSFQQKHSASVQEIEICEHLQRPISRHKLNIFLKVGLARNSERMIKAASRIQCSSNQLQERFNYFLGLGLPFCVLCRILSSSPAIFSQSLYSLQKKVDFLFSYESNPLQALESNPRYLYYSLEHRIMPRYKLYEWLRKNNVLKSELGVKSIIMKSEKSFEKKYVKLHPEGTNYFRQCMLIYEHNTSSARET